MTMGEADRARLEGLGAINRQSSGLDLSSATAFNPPANTDSEGKRLYPVAKDGYFMIDPVLGLRAANPDAIEKLAQQVHELALEEVSHTDKKDGAWVGVRKVE